MIITTCLALAVLDIVAFFKILLRYTEDLEVDKFLSEAPLDAILRASGHMKSAMLMLGIATIWSA